MRLPALVFGGAMVVASFSQAQTPIALPGGSAGIDFDDMRYAPASGSSASPARESSRCVVPTTAGAHCVASANGSVFVCDPKKGRLLVFRDGY